MKVLSIQVGKPKTIQYQGKEVSTGIFKEPVNGPIMLNFLNLEGDGQADLRVHGGKDKALYAYSYDAYASWQKLRPQDTFSYGAFGENLCFETLPENKMYIGDTYELGDAIVQVAQPRFPCYKLSIKFNDPKILKQFMQSGRPGVYFRVLKEGLINVGDSLKLIQQEKVHLSITDLLALYKNPIDDSERIKELLKINALPSQWREEFESWLKESI